MRSYWLISDEDDFYWYAKINIAGRHRGAFAVQRRIRDCEGRIVMYAKRILFCVLLIAATSLVHAQEPSNVHPSLTEKYVLDLGIFFPDRSFNINVDGSIAGANPIIRFEDEFGLNPSDEVFAIDFGWRFGKKWSLLTQYFQSSGTRGAVLDEDIEWNDVVFGQGTSAVAGQEFKLVRVFFGRQFNTSERHDFGVGAGLHWLEIGAFIEGEIIVGGAPNQFDRESVNVKAPLPNIGVWYRYSLSPKWAFRSRYDYLNADVGDFSGTMTNAALGLNYQMFENFGVGLNYNFFELDLGITKPDWQGQTKSKYEGLFVFISAYW